MRVTADLDLCQGHAVCAMEAPEVFAYDKDANKVRILDGQPGDLQVANVQNAVRYCPTAALALDAGTETAA